MDEILFWVDANTAPTFHKAFGEFSDLFWSVTDNADVCRSAFSVL
jgi:hypothetical protein